MTKYISASSFLAATVITAAGSLAGCATPDNHAVTTMKGSAAELQGGKLEAVILPVTPNDSTHVAGRFGDASVFVAYNSRGQGFMTAKIGNDFVSADVALSNKQQPLLTNITYVPTSWTRTDAFPRPFADIEHAREIANLDVAGNNERIAARNLEALPAQVSQLVAAAGNTYAAKPTVLPNEPTDLQAICEEALRTTNVSVNSPLGYGRGYTFGNRQNGEVFLYMPNYALHAITAGSQEIRISLSSFKRDEVTVIHLNTPEVMIDQMGGKMLVTPMNGAGAGMPFARDYKPGGNDKYSNLIKQARDAANAVTIATSGSGCGSRLGLPSFKSILTGEDSAKIAFKNPPTLAAPVRYPNDYLYNNLNIRTYGY